ncbi:hypothetical protein ACFOWE_11190 [Planomonospora corallina]|uniref:Uncharacterized protein n=1 Tax=Planomonospora corallina TaxID=1806052 RepID=A0ABV8I3Y3_9ACTN
MRIPDHGRARGDHPLQRVPHGPHGPAAVVGDQDGARSVQRRGGPPGAEVPGAVPGPVHGPFAVHAFPAARVRPAVAGVDAEQGLAGGPDPGLGDGPAPQRERHHLHHLGEGLPQPPPGLVVAERGDQDDLGPGPGREQRGEPRPAGAAAAGAGGHDGHGRVGAEPLGLALDVHVEQGVADDDERTGPHEQASSSASQSMWITARCTS